MADETVEIIRRMEEGNSIRIADEEDEEVRRAAHILCLMHKSKVDPETARESSTDNGQPSLSNTSTQTTVEFPNKKTTTTAQKKHQHIEPDDERHRNKKMKRTKPVTSSSSSRTPLLPPFQHLHGLVGRCSKPFSRVLTASDVRDHYSRLIITPPNYKEFVAPLLTQGDCIDEGIQVTIYDERGKEYPMMLKYWCNKYYVLTSAGWKQFCHDQDLVSHETHKDVLTLWMFRRRHTHNLCCAITKG